MMRKREKGKLTGKAIRCIASAVCVLGVLAVCLGIAGYQNKVQAEGDQVVTRGVIDSLGQIPQTKKTLYDEGTQDTKETLGKKENPFLILEVVPYEEYALYGYHISGCEPIDMSQMNGHTSDVMGMLQSLKSGIAKQQNEAFFFEEEPERKLKYDADSGIPQKSVDNEAKNGYYERVEDGQGYFTQAEDGTIQKTSGGNLIWHTMCKTEQEENKQTFLSIEDAAKNKLDQVGDRVYTVRYNTEEDPAYKSNNGYFYYQNNDNFLKNSLGLTDEEAKDYSVVIKTITPKELNASPEWVNYSDLILFTGKEYYKQSGLWKKYNRLGKKPTNSGDTYDTNGFVNTSSNKNRDISWQVAMKIFERVSAKKNYAAIILGTTLYKVDDPALSGSTKSGKTLYAYDWNFKKTTSTIGSGTRSNNNVYKLALMLLSMDQDLFKKLYLTDENPLGKKLIDDQGNFLLPEDKEDQEYWSIYSFLTIPPVEETGYINPYDYWIKNDDYGLWEKYGILGNLNDGNYNTRVDGHVYTFNDNNALSFEYTHALETPNSKFTDYQDYLNEYYKVSDGSNHGGTPSDAVRYILGDNSKNNEEKITGNLNILDIEPCYDSKNGYSLQKSYIRMMIPKFIGDIQITHMTTAEFIGNAEDLNSTYDLIFMGLDYGAYTTVQKNIQDPDTGNWINGKFTDWNDNEMDGKIYFHTGDSMSTGTVDNLGRSRSVQFLWSESLKQNVKGSTLRFPGNDITKLKQKELKAFLDAGYPIVAVPYLYRTDKIRIDQNSNICKFIQTNKEKSALYATNDTAKIYEALKNKKPEVTFTALPVKYDGTTDKGKAEIKNKNYLERDSADRSLMRFQFSVEDPKNQQYSCRIYLDQNQDGKFASDELYYDGKQFSADSGEQTVICKLSRLYMGLVQWKIEVYQVGNEGVRFVQTGCSAAKNLTGDKKKISVLQIMPKHGDYKGKLKLSSDANGNELFKKYYNALDDYVITVDTITADEYMQKFTAENPFVYDGNREITFEGTALNPVRMSDQQTEWYNKYNMIIIGFGDTYGKVNIKNTYGAVDFIKFFIADGKSVLFTHDLTSMHNIQENDFGYSANVLLRDTMGMNRYKAISNQLSESERNSLLEYQKKFTYDTVTDVKGNALEQKQGFTYYAMKRLGWNSSDGKMPYQYLITNTKGESICGVTNTSKTTGFNNNNDLTSMVTQTNEGQITEYPYKIDQTFKIAQTHGQWYQLNMEDPEVTVWYCLSDNENGSPSAWQGSDNNGDGTGATYGVSPNDAANNYYIYSKGNVFYSGVGHSTVNDEMEAKLFINTMISAYRASYQPPMVEVLNPEAELKDINKMAYQMSFAQEYNNGLEEVQSTDELKVAFSPVELNAISTKLDCSIYYEVNGKKEYVTEIYRKDTNEKIEVSRDSKGNLILDKDGNPMFENLHNMDEYYFLYPEKYLNEWKDGSGVKQPSRRKITFKIKNNKSKMPGYTTLDMSVQALFQLD